MPSAHALLGASKAYQWIQCPGSIALTRDLPDTSGPDAEWGVLCHDLAAAYAIEQLQGQTVEWDSVADPRWTEEMWQVAREYVEFIRRTVTLHCGNHEVIYFVEQQVSTARFIPDGFGTADMIVVCPTLNLVIVIDLKTGTGNVVEAEGNEQMRIYAAGVIDWLGPLADVDLVVTAIAQPRLNHWPSEELTAAELEVWVQTVVAPAAQLAFAGSDELVVGSHCKWCKAEGQCPAQAARLKEATAALAKNVNVLTPEEIAKLMPVAEDAMTLAKKLKDRAVAVAKEKGLPGFKFVAGRGYRSWTDEGVARDCMRAAGLSEDDIHPKRHELISVAQAEKILPKRHEVFELVVSSPGAPTLVPESDKRPAIGTDWSAFE